MKALITDIDGTLLGDDEGLKELNSYLLRIRKSLFLVYATGRSVEEYGMLEGKLIEPDAAVVNTGADIYTHGKSGLIELVEWKEKTGCDTWDARKVEFALNGISELVSQGHFSSRKVCYFCERDKAAEAGKKAAKELKKAGIKAKVIISHGKYVDILPEKCDKASAAAFLLEKEGINCSDVIVAGDSENDLDLFIRFRKGIIVGNALGTLKDAARGLDVYQAVRPYASGVLEGLKYFTEKK
ncbi:MAG TPA: HAD-IIB family hydrolase [Candidatus Goldiibacteriota bacterium]|nr:HAD-IIB family hydrolase [Candidatus Goldiibacteriota bacterium]